MEQIIKNTMTKSHILTLKELADALKFFLFDNHPLKFISMEILKTLFQSKYETVKIAALESIL